MKAIFKDHRGIALLLTVSITALLVAAALELHRNVRASLISTAMTRDRFVLSEMATSGVHAAMAVLIKDKKESYSDSLQEDWADPEKLKEILNEVSFDEGDLSVRIIDELGKIQINTLVTTDGGQNFNEPQRLIWERFLNWMKSQHESFEEMDVTAIINSIKDWLDTGDDGAITGVTGAESDYYEDLDPPYTSRNGSVRLIGELMRIKGITPELFYGIDEIQGISQFVTVYGTEDTGSVTTSAESGKININTAPLPVILSLLPSESEDIAQAIIDYREAKDGDEYTQDLSSPTAMVGAVGLADADIDFSLFTSTSDIFRIVATGSMGEMKTTVTAIVKREQDAKTGKWGCRVLSWKAG